MNQEKAESLAQKHWTSDCQHQCESWVESLIFWKPQYEEIQRGHDAIPCEEERDSKHVEANVVEFRVL